MLDTSVVGVKIAFVLALVAAPAVPLGETGTGEDANGGAGVGSIIGVFVSVSVAVAGGVAMGVGVEVCVKDSASVAEVAEKLSEVDDDEDEGYSAG